jgi:hypothetical protein
VSKRPVFDPYALLEALAQERVTYVVVGAFARVVHGSAETTDGLDIAPSLREENLRRLGRVLDRLEARGPGRRPVDTDSLPSSGAVSARTSAGELTIVPTPWGTRGYDDLRRRAYRENLGRGARPAVASVVDCVRMLEASPREPDAERLLRLRRMLDLERQRFPHRRLTIER